MIKSSVSYQTSHKPISQNSVKVSSPVKLGSIMDGHVHLLYVDLRSAEALGKLRINLSGEFHFGRP